MYGNNQSAGQATFRVSMNATVSSVIVHNFIVMDVINVLAPVALKFSPTESIRFRVTLPNGQDLNFVTPDTTPPAPPNPLVQISALIALKRIAPSPKIEGIIVK